MGNLSFGQRGPFKIAGEAFFDWHYHVKSYCSWSPLPWDIPIGQWPDWRRSLHYRCSSWLAARGPFHLHYDVRWQALKLQGWCPPYNRQMGPYIHVVLPMRSVRYSYDGKPTYPAGKTLNGFPWIYYSRNISNGPVCH